MCRILLKNNSLIVNNSFNNCRSSYGTRVSGNKRKKGLETYVIEGARRTLVFVLTFLSHSITFSLFHSKLKTSLVRKSYPPPSLFLSVGLVLMALDCSSDLFAHRFYVLVLFFSVLVIPKCGRLSWPALWSTFRRTIK